MFFRVSISCVLIVIGVLSPWLVRDWLDWRADERAANRFYDALASFPDRVRATFDRGEDEPVSVATSGSPPDGTELEGKPYPLASRTSRVLHGFFPGASSSGPGPLSFFGSGNGVPSSALSRAVAEATAPGLSGRLEKLGLRLGDPVFVRVFKEEHELELWMRARDDDHFTLFKIYRVVDRSGSLGPKLREGDGQAPEGFYSVGASRMRPETRHHLGFDVGYPNEYDVHHGRTGSDILVHGGEVSAGSFALSRESMNEVFTLAEAALREGQPFFRVNSFPFRMTDRRMEKEWNRQPEWISFWSNLKEGYDFFENVNLPPETAIEGGKYRFKIESR